LVIDDAEHAVTSGTFDVVAAGGRRLLLCSRDAAADPSSAARAVTGWRPPADRQILAEQQAGPGELDLRGTLAALIAKIRRLDRAPSIASRMCSSASFAHPGS
jgi:hypothetical protein